jgi:competence protein ComFC
MKDFEALSESNLLRVIHSEDKMHLCLMDPDTENAFIFKTGINELKCLKVLKGAGTFLSNDFILLFYNNSGYGYVNTDSYLYQISTDKIHSLFLETYEQIIFARNSFFDDSFFVSVGSGIIKTKTLLILKDDHGGIYFYKINEVIDKKELTHFYYLPIEGQNIFKTLLSFDEESNVLEFINYSYTVEYRQILFEQRLFDDNKENSLILSNNLYQGSSIDYHILSSRINQDGSFEITRTHMGELLHQFKYKGDKSKVSEISERIIAHLKSQFADFDILIPIPPSNWKRPYQPLIELTKQISTDFHVYYDLEYLIKKKTTQLKSIDDNETRIEILKNAFSIPDERYKGKRVLLFDDHYRSGETLNAAAKVLLEQGKVGNIFVLTITKTKNKG